MRDSESISPSAILPVMRLDPVLPRARREFHALVLGLLLLGSCASTTSSPLRSHAGLHGAASDVSQSEAEPSSSGLEDADGLDAVGESHAGHPDGAEHAEHGPGTQTFNVFLGGIDEVRGEAGLAFGVDYEYRLRRKWGIGGFAEGVTGAKRSFVGGLQAYWHAVGDLVLVSGVGMERREHEWEPILRVGGLYELAMVEGFVLSPSLFYDFTPDHGVLVGGLSIGKSW